MTQPTNADLAAQLHALAAELTDTRETVEQLHGALAAAAGVIARELHGRGREPARVWRFLGRYAEDPIVEVEAASAEQAARIAERDGLRVRPGYLAGGALVPEPAGR